MKSHGINPRPHGSIKLTDSQDVYQIDDRENVVMIFDIILRKDDYKKK